MQSSQYMLEQLKKEVCEANLDLVAKGVVIYQCSQLKPNSPKILTI